eukprot:scaffold225_cov235-Pinguiococcus_pyrenoidosus.AAC.16
MLPQRPLGPDTPMLEEELDELPRLLSLRRGRLLPRRRLDADAVDLRPVTCEGSRHHLQGGRQRRQLLRAFARKPLAMSRQELEVRQRSIRPEESQHRLHGAQDLGMTSTKRSFPACKRRFRSVHSRPPEHLHRRHSLEIRCGRRESLLASLEAPDTAAPAPP